MLDAIKQFQTAVLALEPFQKVGRITAVQDSSVAVSGLSEDVVVGSLLQLGSAKNGPLAEVIKLEPDQIICAPFQSVAKVRISQIAKLRSALQVSPSTAWRGRVINAFAQPIDDKGPLAVGESASLTRIPNPMRRGELGHRLTTGLNVFDTILPIAKGQRIGLFAGSGVGKTTLLRQLAQGIEADTLVFVLIGERGRELREFISGLDLNTRQRAIIVAATSDRSPLERRRALDTAMIVAEKLRDQGEHVVLFADSLTRFAEAHRDIAGQAGEPVGLGGWPVSTAQRLAEAIERAGPGEGHGAITAIFSVLVQGSDMEEPLADLVRGLLDGHVALSRDLAEAGHFPAIDVTTSVSRSLLHVSNAIELKAISQARKHLAVLKRGRPLIQAGLYSAGDDADLDNALAIAVPLTAFVHSGLQPSEQGQASSMEQLIALVEAK